MPNAIDRFDAGSLPERLDRKDFCQWGGARALGITHDLDVKRRYVRIFFRIIVKEIAKRFCEGGTLWLKAFPHKHRWSLDPSRDHVDKQS